MAVHDTNPLAALPQADQDAIGTTLGALLSGFRERNAERLEMIYSDDADWVNAFGTAKRGGREIIRYLRGLFADENFNAGETDGPPEITVKVLGDDVVLVSAHITVLGQKLIGGGEIAQRDNFSLRVLQRQDDGRWLIVSEMYNDANTDRTYEGA